MKILFILFFLFCFSSFAQQHIRIQGKVVDAETNLPLLNANILIPGISGLGTFTDSMGEFISLLNYKLLILF